MKRIFAGLSALALTATLSVAASGLAEACSNRTPRVTHRQVHQRARIMQGVRSHELTRLEVLSLRAGQARVQSMKWRAKADGQVTMAERMRLARVQNLQSARIYRLKHNARER